jgi:hypothetical protein
MSITVRAYTHGYTLFHPHIVVAWHEYTRNYRVKHWDDDKEWWKKDMHSKMHYFDIFCDLKGVYGLGTQRTVADYIEFSGIQFLDLPVAETNETITIFENEYKEFDDDWRNWIKENIQLKVPIESIRNTLLDAKFRVEDADKEILMIEHLLL